jgi:hypothetical protein
MEQPLRCESKIDGNKKIFNWTFQETKRYTLQWLAMWHIFVSFQFASLNKLKKKKKKK